ncbi:MAG TPA: metal-dependent transcriptional regulator [Chthonomonadaceae bacterium]|nr:metal-dependent transcriptional regulator [Chthonomonadaceae bacterium]
MASPSVEDYIKAIYKAQADAETVTTQDIAGRVQVSAPAVSKMLKRLTELRLIEHTPYQGVRLTPAGEKMALEIIRHHRLLELYLVQALGYSWDEVHEEAERLEHHISEEFEARIDALLGHPTACPHGDPIPTREGVVATVASHALTEQRTPAQLTIRRVRDTDSGLLRHLKQLGLLPGTAIEFLEQEPYGGAFVLRVGGDIVRVAPQAAQQIFVGAAQENLQHETNPNDGVLPEIPLKRNSP